MQLQQLLADAQKHTEGALQNPYVMAVLKISVILYASRIAPRLPDFVAHALDSTPVKLIAVSLIGFLANIDIQLSILLAVVFVLGSNLMSGRGLLESFAPYVSDITKVKTLLGTPALITNATLLTPQSDIYPGCGKVTYQDLLDVFKGDINQMRQTVMYTYGKLVEDLQSESDAEKLQAISDAIGVPHNLALNDENAPLIATMLMNYGFVVSQTCQAPK
jgi:hypothetical protein